MLHNRSHFCDPHPSPICVRQVQKQKNRSVCNRSIAGIVSLRSMACKDRCPGRDRGREARNHATSLISVFSRSRYHEKHDHAVPSDNPIEAGQLSDGSPDLYFRVFYCWNSGVGAKMLGITAFISGPSASVAISDVSRIRARTHKSERRDPRG